MLFVARDWCSALNSRPLPTAWTSSTRLNTCHWSGWSNTCLKSCRTDGCFHEPCMDRWSLACDANVQFICDSVVILYHILLCSDLMSYMFYSCWQLHAWIMWFYLKLSLCSATGYLSTFLLYCGTSPLTMLSWNLFKGNGYLVGISSLSQVCV